MRGTHLKEGSKDMKKQLYSLALCAFLGLGAAMAAPLAQDSSAGASSGGQNQAVTPHHADPARQLQFLTKKLNLTEDQQKQILPILTQRQEQMQQILADNSLSRKDRFAKIRELREQTENSIKAVLNDEQKQQYDQMRQQARERMQQRRQERQNGTQN